MELRQLRYFVAVAEKRNFGRAADRLRLAQSGLSQQIKALERSLAADLLVRDRSGVQLTEAGEFVLDQARLVIELADRMAETLRRDRRGRRGLLKVATGIAGLQPLAGSVLALFRQRVPGVVVEVHPGLVPQNVEALIRRAVDVAFVSQPFDVGPGLSYRPVATLELLVMVREGHPLASLERIPREAVLNEPFVTWPRSVNPLLMDHVNDVLFGGTHPDAVEVCDVTQGSRIAQVIRGVAPAAIGLPEEAELRVPGVVYRRMEEPSPIVEYGIAWPDATVTPFVRAFIDVAGELALKHSPPASDRGGVPESLRPSGS